MPSWTQDFNSTFFLAVGSLTSASFALVLRYLIKSKCKRFECCGLVVDRDVDAELRSEAMELASKNKQDGVIGEKSVSNKPPDDINVNDNNV
jgi:hypothetical protein